MELNIPYERTDLPESDNTYEMTILVNNIPEWQKDSEFFMNLIEGNEAENDEITISSRFIRENDTVNNFDDFIIVYEIQNFFGLKNPSNGLLLYLMKMDTETYKKIRKMYNYDAEDEHKSESAIRFPVEEKAEVNPFQFSPEEKAEVNPFQFPVDIPHTETEISLTDGRTFGGSQNRSPISLLWDIFDIVHYNGESNKIKASLLFARKGNIQMIKFYVQYGVQISYEHCIEASHGNKNCLEYCLKNLILNSEQVSVCFENAIKSKKMDCLQYLFEMFPNAVKYDNANYFSYFAGNVDNLQALIFLHQNGFPWDDATCLASSYSLQCLKYLVDNGCSCDFRELLYSCGQSCFNYVYEKYKEQYDFL